MRLYDNWRIIMRKSWSMRFALVAGILSGCEVALPIIGDRFDPGVFAALSAFFCCAALVARIVAQKDI